MWERLDRIEEKGRDRLLAPLLDKVIPRWVHPVHVTLARWGLLAAAVAMYFAAIPLVIQTAVLLAAASTDTIDGVLARTRGQKSDLGGRLDATADWALGFWMGCLVIVYGLLSATIVVLMIAPQLVVVATGRKIAQDGGEPPKAGAVARSQFVAVVLGFGSLLLGSALKRSRLLALGYGLIYLEIALACVLAARGLRLTRS